MTSFNLDGFWQSESEDHIETAINTFKDLKNDFEAMLEICTTAIQNDNKIMFFGNGGSAADAQHLATELTIRYKTDRAPIAAIALTTDTSTLTAAGNDMGFDQIFARQIQAIGKTGDIAIGISTSGNSSNVLNALKLARDANIKTIGFTGNSGGKMDEHCDVLIKIPSNTTARIQEMHITLGQMLCGALEQKLGLVIK